MFWTADSPLVAARLVQIRLKLKHRETLDIICGAVIGLITQPSEVVAGLILDGELRIVGRSTPLKARGSRELARRLHPPAGEHPWPAVVKGAGLDSFNRDKGLIQSIPCPSNPLPQLG